MSNLGVCLSARFECVGEPQDLEESISLGQLANALTPDDSPDKHSRLCNLAVSLFSRFEREGRAEDLEEAIELDTRAVELVPNGHVSKPMLLSNLGSSLARQFERSGSANNLEKAIELLTHAVELTPEDDPDKPMWLMNLGTSHEQRFERLGNLEDLERAIALQSRSVDLTPDGHPDKPMYLSNAGSSLQTRFLRLGDFADLGRAIVLQARAVELTSDGHPDKPALLNNLAIFLQGRYLRTRDAKDLEEAIAHQFRAVELTPDGHPDKPTWLNNLGAQLHSRFKQSGNLDDLDQAITHYTAALTLTPEGHPDKSSWLCNLSHSLEERFERVGNVSDLEEAIKCSTRPVELTPENHTQRAQNLRFLGLRFFTRLRSPHAHADDASRAMEAFLEAMQHPTSHPLERLRASGLYARLLTEFSHLLTTPPRLSLLEAWRHAISLVPQCIWLGNNVRGRYTSLSEELSDVRIAVNYAATAAIAAGEYDLALEWLETGRAVVWSQVLQLRTPLDDLHRIHPQLAERLQHVSQALQLAASSSLPVSIETQLPSSSHDIQAPSSHGYALEYDKLVSTIRELEGFEDFMQPKTLSQLAGACRSGPVVVINVHKSRCDALVLCRVGDVIHIPLPELSLDRAMGIQEYLWDLLRAKRLLNRCRGDMQDENDDRGGRVTAMDPPDMMRVILADLWNRVVKPIMDVVCTLEPPSTTLPHVTWCPTGPLVFLPLHAAGIYPSDDRISAPSQTIMDLAVSSYTPTLEALLKPRARVTPAGQDPRVLIVSQPDTPGGNPIPGTTTEAAIVMSLVGESKPLDDADGTIQAVLEGMATHEWVHLACHGIQNCMDPMSSAFLLYDGQLTLADLMSHHLPNADLAVLSACQTATGDEKLSEEAVHLAAGMLNIGYKSVVGTMWSISDYVAPDVMKVFYTVMAEQVRAGGELQPAYALHEAIKVLRRSSGRGVMNDFLRWVPFVHFGL
ncbi:CHAT domain-containing protein [Irpex rosettiformis]|uniref:CHAT domain-containing protein n=1 Tax=Irpex rosettiformis TaxID=378272 RepID=A0ACB8TND4_9APHY|nr:CHAT domain-containing protein [Irpex rosettiformis]